MSGFQAAFDQLSRTKVPGAELAHGYSEKHKCMISWVELTKLGLVCNATLEAFVSVVSADQFYAKNLIAGESVQRWTLKAAVTKVCTTGSYGPWHKVV